MACFEQGIATLRCVPYFLGNIINLAVVFSAVAAAIFLLLGGIRFITSGGDQAKMKQAKQTITFAILGLLMILFSFVIIKLVSTISGVECRIIGISC